MPQIIKNKLSVIHEMLGKSDLDFVLFVEIIKNGLAGDLGELVLLTFPHVSKKRYVIVRKFKI